MKRLLIVAGLCLPFLSSAQVGGLGDKEADKTMDELRKQESKAKRDSLWDAGGVITMDFSNVFLKNWAGGGLNSVSGKALLSLFANRAWDGKTWDNSLNLGYGIVNRFDSDPNDNVDNSLMFKSDDRIDLSSKFGRKAFSNWYYSGLLNFRSQFAPGFANPEDSNNDSLRISNFLAPGYVIASIGLDFRPPVDKDNPKAATFSLFISPITSKTTIVNDEILSNAGAFGVEEGKRIRYEVGGYVKMSLQKKIMEATKKVKDKDVVTESMSFMTKVDLFSNYLENPQNIDVSWETLLSFQFMRYFNFTTGTHLIYDHDIDSRPTNTYDANNNLINTTYGPGTQFKWVTGLGFVYKF